MPLGRMFLKYFKLWKACGRIARLFRACGQELSSREPKEEREFRMRSITRNRQLGRRAAKGTADCGWRVQEIGGW